MPAAAIAPPPPSIGFHNGLAVRIGLLAGVLSIVLSSPIASIAPPLAIVSLAGAGWLAVFLYRWRTGQRLSAMNGAHLGGICGVFEFAISAILIALRFSEPAATEALTAQWRQLGMSDAQITQALSEMHNPLVILFMGLILFAVFTLLPAFGGAIGAKLLDRD